MPVPQRVNFLVEQASCLFMKSLLRMVPHLSSNQQCFFPTKSVRNICRKTALLYAALDSAAINDTAYSRFINYTPETGFLYIFRIITDSVQETRFLAIYIYMEYAVSCPVDYPDSCRGP